MCAAQDISVYYLQLESLWQREENTCKTWEIFSTMTHFYYAAEVKYRIRCLSCKGPSIRRSLNINEALATKYICIIPYLKFI